MVHVHVEVPMRTENNAVRNKKERAAPEPLLIGSHEASEEIAKRLIPKHHPHLAEANILYTCRNKATKSGGRPQAGSVKKASPMDKHLGRNKFDGDNEVTFVMCISLPTWNELSPEKRIAQVDHLLSRCVAVENEKTGETKWSVRPPQVQEFVEVAARNGAWTDDLADLRDNLK